MCFLSINNYNGSTLALKHVVINLKIKYILTQEWELITHIMQRNYIFLPVQHSQNAHGSSGILWLSANFVQHQCFSEERLLHG